MSDAVSRLERGAAPPPRFGFGGWRPGSMRPAGGQRDTLRGVRVGYCGLVIAAAALQLGFFGGVEGNAPSTLIALAASLIGILQALGGQRFRALPISALILLFFTTSGTAGALVVKTLEWSPLADRLTVPVRTFAVLLGAQAMLLVADQIYLNARPLQRLRETITRRALVPLGLLRWPGAGELWLLGALGCASVILTGTDFESDAAFGAGTAGVKALRAFGFLKYAPFLIPFSGALSGTPRRARAPLVRLAAYFAGLVAISFATNSRSTFADAVPTIAICGLVALALGRIDLRRIPPAKLAGYAVVVALASLLLSRISLAMVVARDYRYGADTASLVRTTLEAVFNTEWLNAAKAKMDTQVMTGNYSEEYVDSRFFARFLLTKFHDNVVYYFSLMGPDQLASYKAFMFDRLAATLPDPVLRALGFTLDKQDLVVSNGDYIVYIVDGWGLGGFKTGSMIGEAYGFFGAWFPVVIVAAGLALFVCYDAFAAVTAFGGLAVSPLILLLAWNLVGTTAAFGLGAETVTAVAGGILRNLPQTALIYALAAWGAQQVARFLRRL